MSRILRWVWRCDGIRSSERPSAAPSDFFSLISSQSPPYIPFDNPLFFSQRSLHTASSLNYDRYRQLRHFSLFSKTHFLHWLQKSLTLHGLSVRLESPLGRPPSTNSSQYRILWVMATAPSQQEYQPSYITANLSPSIPRNGPNCIRPPVEDRHLATIIDGKTKHGRIYRSIFLYYHNSPEVARVIKDYITQPHSFPTST